MKKLGNECWSKNKEKTDFDKDFFNQWIMQFSEKPLKMLEN